MQKLGKDLQFRFEFHPVMIRRDTKKGCLESHLEIIQLAYNRGWDKILILEDDLQPTQYISSAHLSGKSWKILENVPDDWDMLYLGGTIKQKIYDEEDYRQYVDFQNREWVRMCCWTTHAYIINLKNFQLVADLAKAFEQEQQLDHLIQVTINLT
jgi:GR25 family glycosyltransferase involved in LPS biosynthesis